MPLARKCDLIVEVAHPDITKQYGVQFLKYANYLVRVAVVLEVQLSLFFGHIREFTGDIMLCSWDPQPLWLTRMSNLH